MSAITDYVTLISQLSKYQVANRLAERYYEGEQKVPLLNIAVPQIMNHIKLVVGWPGTTIDVLGERIDWNGWDTPASMGLQDVYSENRLGTESQLGHFDALLLGTGFICVGTGDTAEGEPECLINVESAKDMIGQYNYRSRRYEIAAKKVFDSSGQWTQGVLYEKNATTYLKRNSDTSPWRIDYTDTHNMGRVPVFGLPNRPRGSRREGKSEITKAVRSYTNMAVRTLLGMEVNREFFSAPQRYALGAREDAFTDEHGHPIPGWRAIMGSVWNLERDEAWVDDHPGSDGLPTVGEFTPNPPGPYIDQIKGLSQMFAAEVGIPPSYLGFVTDSAPSADAIRALEARLVKRAERRISTWDVEWQAAGQLASFLVTGTEPALSEITTEWADPAVPARGADTDRAVKLVGAGILPAESSVTQEMVGLTPAQRKRLERDHNKALMRDLIRGAANQNGAPADDNANNAGASSQPDDNSAGAGAAQQAS